MKSEWASIFIINLRGVKSKKCGTVSHISEQANTSCFYCAGNQTKPSNRVSVKSLSVSYFHIKVTLIQIILCKYRKIVPISPGNKWQVIKNEMFSHVPRFKQIVFRIWFIHSVSDTLPDMKDSCLPLIYDLQTWHRLPLIHHYSYK